VDIRPDLAPKPEVQVAAAGLPQDAAAGLPQDAAAGQTVLHRIAAAPDAAIALAAEDETLTYGDLRRRAGALARVLTGEVGAGRRIGLLSRNTVEGIVALLAIQWSGGAFVPLDPGAPTPRLAAMAGDAGLAAILTDADAAGAIAAACGVKVLEIAALERAGRPGAPPALPASDALAYIVFTSGSTGRAKGVAVPHHALLASVEARPALFPEPLGGVLLTFPLVFDGAVLAVCSTLARGARLVLPHPAPVPDPAGLCRTIEAAGVTHTVMVPRLHEAVLDAAAPGQLDGLVVCAVAGEACDPGLVRRHRAALPGAALVNEYGPTEATVWASAWRCAPEDGDAPMPIGRAIPGARIYLLDGQLRPVPPEGAGEIFIGGEGVAWGYVGQPGLTAGAFLPDPWAGTPGARMYRTGDRARARADGALVFLGRADRQIKLRGYRIEPGEIEAALRAQPGVAEAVAMLRQGAATARLVAYVAARPPARADAAALEAALAACLPAYMVPRVMVLDAWPLLASGKLDVSALPDAREDGADHGPAPEPGEETVLAALWREVLGLPTVSATADFFALGGSSLLGMRLVAQIRARLGASVELHDLFRCPTIRTLAPVVFQARGAGPAGRGAIVRGARRRTAPAAQVAGD